jgi:hypothetical protein
MSAEKGRGSQGSASPSEFWKTEIKKIYQILIPKI